MKGLELSLVFTAMFTFQGAALRQVEIIKLALVFHLKDAALWLTATCKFSSCPFPRCLCCHGYIITGESRGWAFSPNTMIWWRSPLKRLDCSAHKGEGRGERERHVFISLFPYLPLDASSSTLCCWLWLKWSFDAFWIEVPPQTSYLQLHSCLINCCNWGLNAEWWAMLLLSGVPVGPVWSSVGGGHPGSMLGHKHGEGPHVGFPGVVWVRSLQAVECLWQNSKFTVLLFVYSLCLFPANTTHLGALESSRPINTWMFLP